MRFIYLFAFAVLTSGAYASDLERNLVRLELPHYYIGHWKSSSSRSPPSSYLIKNDGTIEEFFSHDIKNKLADIEYRVLRIEPQQVVLFIKETELEDEPGIINPYYTFWILKPRKSTVKYDGLWLHSSHTMNLINKDAWLLPNQKLLELYMKETKGREDLSVSSFYREVE
jgi:hypothetical protein